MEAISKYGRKKQNLSICRNHALRIFMELILQDLRLNKIICLLILYLNRPGPASNYLFKFTNKHTRKKSQIYSVLTIKIQKRRHWHHSDGFIFVNVEHSFNGCEVLFHINLINWTNFTFFFCACLQIHLSRLSS